MPDVARGDLFTEVNLKVVRDTVKLPHAVYDEQPLDAPGKLIPLRKHAYVIL